MREPRQPEGMGSSSATPSSVGAPLVRSITRKAAPLLKWDISFQTVLVAEERSQQYRMAEPRRIPLL